MNGGKYGSLGFDGKVKPLVSLSCFVFIGLYSLVTAKPRSKEETSLENNLLFFLSVCLSLFLYFFLFICLSVRPARLRVCCIRWVKRLKGVIRKAPHPKKNYQAKIQIVTLWRLFWCLLSNNPLGTEKTKTKKEIRSLKCVIFPI